MRRESRRTLGESEARYAFSEKREESVAAEKAAEIEPAGDFLHFCLCGVLCEMEGLVGVVEEQALEFRGVIGGEDFGIEEFEGLDGHISASNDTKTAIFVWDFEFAQAILDFFRLLAEFVHFTEVVKEASHFLESSQFMV